MDLMQKKMKASSTDSSEITANWQASKEEQVATWHFVMLDKNKNKVCNRFLFIILRDTSPMVTYV